jgi:hypothetical protein
MKPFKTQNKMKKRFNFSLGGFSALIGLSLVALYFIGYVKCVIKFVKCDFEPSYKAEAVYAVGCFTGLGGIIGWVDVQDEKK